MRLAQVARGAPIPKYRINALADVLSPAAAKPRASSSSFSSVRDRELSHEGSSASGAGAGSLPKRRRRGAASRYGHPLHSASSHRKAPRGVKSQVLARFL
jgi:hypothetical protein